ncbi:MAG: hypothetical protein L0K86_16945 [Actinomycetia bacterium]|nr:hypothetical protein [Actinomycetes bacterium]
MTPFRSGRSFARAVPVAAVATTLLISGCGADADESAHAGESGQNNHDHELTEAEPRLVTTYDGGLHVLDGDSLDVLETVELDGFLRVHRAGDGRHVIVSTDEAFRVLDAGVWSEEHGDHSHHFSADPELTDVEFEADHPGHVIHAAGRTALFSDGTGSAEVFETGDLAHGRPATTTVETAEAPPGAGGPVDGSGTLTTIGDDEGAYGVRVRDADGDEIARSEQCPGAHGAAPAAGGHVVVGCEDGVLVYDGDMLTKINSPDAYGRIGNHAGGEDGKVVLGDYKVKPNADLERPTRVSLIDTVRKRIRLVELGTSYSFRSLARGPHGEAIVLGTDGRLHVIDPATGQVTKRISVIGEWREPLDWQRPRPTLFVEGDAAYVSDPASKELHRVDLSEGEITASTTLPESPNELSGVSG